jgi:hypothetical protein
VQIYWRRYGPGLVIYWYGYVAELNSEASQGILVADAFPKFIIEIEPFPDLLLKSTTEAEEAETDSGH